MYPNTITLISNTTRPALNDDFLNCFDQYLTNLGARNLSKRILHKSIAITCQVETNHDTSTLADRLQKEFSLLPIDIIVTPGATKLKRLLIADMDSTIIEQECIDELADFAGKRDDIARITEQAMAGRLDFESSLKARVRMLAGLPVSALEDVFNEKITLTAGARILVQTMNKAGAVTALVSGGFTFFAERIGMRCGFQITQANTLITRDGCLTGEVRTPILGRDAKRQALLRMAQDNGFGANQVLAVGDGANDLAMLETAGLGIAFRAKPTVAARSHTRINHGDLTALLYLQGFSVDDFVADDT